MVVTRTSIYLAEKPRQHHSHLMRAARPGARHGGGGPVVKDRCVRIAYCLYGQARRLDEGASNILGSLERMQPGCNTVRFYVHVWLPAKLGRDGTSQYGDAFSFFYNRPVRHKAPQNVTEQIRRLYYPVAMQAEPARSNPAKGRRLRSVPVPVALPVTREPVS